MVNEIKKIATFNTKIEPYLKPTTDIGVGFYNLDVNTAELTFQITKDDYQLLLSKENANVFVYLRSEKGYHRLIEEEDINFKDPLNGLISFIVPKSFLAESTESTVYGQLYITVKKENEVPNDKSDTVALSKFKFDVGDALINKISGVEKIESLRLFTKLRDKIEEEVEEIKNSLKEGTDHVTKINEATEDGKKEIEILLKSSETQLSDASQKAITEVTSIKNATLNTIKNEKNKTLESFEERSESYLKDIRIEKELISTLLSKEGFVTKETYIEDNDSLKDYINEKFNEVKVEDSGWIKFNLEGEAVKDRHYKLSNQNGYNCSYKTIKHKNYVETLVRLNADNFESGDVIAKLPEGLCKSTQTEIIRTVPTNCGGAQIVLQPNGELAVWIVDTTKWTKERNSYIYGTLSFIEDN